MFLLKKKQRKVVYFKAKTHLRSEAARTHLSILWWALEPIIMMVIYYIVFGLLLKRGTEDFVPFLLIGLLSWQWFSNSVTHGLNAVDGNSAMISQLKFPKVILPCVNSAMDTFKFGIIFICLIFFMWVYGMPPGEAYISLIPILATQFVFNCAFTNLFALAPPFLPDIKMVVSHILRAGMFLSGVFYDYRTLDEDVQKYFIHNPVAQLMDMYRGILMHNTHPDYLTLGIIFGSGFALLVISHMLFHKLDPILPRALMQR